MIVSEEYKNDLLKLYAKLKQTVMTICQKPACDKISAKQAIAALNQFYDDTNEFFNCQKAYVETLNDDEHKPDDFDRYFTGRFTPFDEYFEVKEIYSDHKGRLCKSDKCYIMHSLMFPLNLVTDILNEAEFVGKIMCDLGGVVLEDKDKPHFLTSEEKNEIERQEREKREKELLEEEEINTINAALKSNSPEQMDIAFTKYGKKKFFVNPENGEEDYYYKYGNQCFTKYGQFIGYSLIVKWNLVEEM